MIEKVSLYIPAFNAEKTIKEVLLSSQKQSLKFDEIIVINDCSTDNTKNIIQEFREIKLINNDNNEGLGKSRNIAIEACRNEIIASIDSDVVLDTYWLENILKDLKKNNVQICGGKLLEKMKSNPCNTWRAKRYKQNWGLDDLSNPPFIYGCNSIQYKKIWREVGGYDEKLKTNGEDVDFSKRIKNIENVNTFYSSKSICFHLQNDNYLSLAKRVWRYHSYGYKIKKPSAFRAFKLILKQFNFFAKRILQDLVTLKLKYILIDFIVFIYFIFFEIKHTFSYNKD